MQDLYIFYSYNFFWTMFRKLIKNKSRLSSDRPTLKYILHEKRIKNKVKLLSDPPTPKYILHENTFIILGLIAKKACTLTSQQHCSHLMSIAPLPLGSSGDRAAATWEAGGPRFKSWSERRHIWWPVLIWRWCWSGHMWASGKMGHCCELANIV